MFLFFAKTVQDKSRRWPPITTGLGIITFAILLGSASLRADPVLHTFALWGRANESEKVFLYAGLMNGFLPFRGLNKLATCLYGITTTQAVAMIDKAYKDHPERWSHSLIEEVLVALTVDGGPCQGQYPLSTSRE
jgi:hypothetical protein